MPSVIVGGRPAPAPTAASLASVSGSFSANRHDQPAVDDLLDLVNPPGIWFAAGQGTSLTSSFVSIVPSVSGRAATTACALATSTSRTGMLRTARYTP